MTEVIEPSDKTEAFTIRAQPKSGTHRSRAISEVTGTWGNTFPSQILSTTQAKISARPSARAFGTTSLPDKWNLPGVRREQLAGLEGNFYLAAENSQEVGGGKEHICLCCAVVKQKEKSWRGGSQATIFRKKKHQPGLRRWLSQQKACLRSKRTQVWAFIQLPSQEEMGEGVSQGSLASQSNSIGDLQANEKPCLIEADGTQSCPLASHAHEHTCI